MSTQPALDKALAQLREDMERGTHVGAQIYVSLHGRVVADMGIGLARPDVEMTSETLVPWLSGGKPITAVALARLWERGLLDLDDPAATYVPEFGQHRKSGVTLRHLLTHTSGLEVHGLNWVHSTWEQALRLICDTPLAAGVVPGRRAAYDPHANWFVLGEVIRRVWREAHGITALPAEGPGREFASIIEEEVYAPAGMRDSWMGLPLKEYQAYGDRVAVFHETNPNLTETPRVAHWDDMDRAAAVSPGGAARGPVRQLGCFYEMLLSRGRAADGTQVLRPQTVEALTARHRVDMMDQTFRHKVDWGLGFLVNSNHYGAETIPYGYGRHASPRAFGHGGMQTTTGYADPEHGLVVAVTFNGLPGEARHSRRVREFNTLVYEDLGLAPAAQE